MKIWVFESISFRQFRFWSKNWNFRAKIEFFVQKLGFWVNFFPKIPISEQKRSLSSKNWVLSLFFSIFTWKLSFWVNFSLKILIFEQKLGFKSIFFDFLAKIIIFRSIFFENSDFFYILIVNRRFIGQNHLPISSFIMFR